MDTLRQILLELWKRDYLIFLEDNGGNETALEDLILEIDDEFNDREAILEEDQIIEIDENGYRKGVIFEVIRYDY